MSSPMFFDGLPGLVRVLVVGVLAYAALIVWLRLSGKRTLSKWNAFDLVITVSLGSTLATVLLSKDVALLEGVVAFGLLVMLQFAITWLAARHDGVRRLVKAQPTLLLSDGRFLHAALRAQRVTESEVRAAVRGAGIMALEDVGAVVLETDGSFSVMRRSPPGASRSALSDTEREDGA